ncbi:MAG: formyltransferase family protein, partial [Ignavibacteriae bacterium]|nr:formyltransferase family protein [Ignavibacteriota bacterium]
GLTTFFLKDKADTGNIVLQEKVDIFEDDDAGTLHDRLSILGADLIIKTIKIIESGNNNLSEQDDSLATKAPKIFKEDCLINWSQPASKIHNQIRGLSPYPAAFTHLQNKVCKIYKSKLTDLQSTLEIGKITNNGKQIFVSTQDFLLEILELQLEGKKRIPSAEFLNGIDKNLLIKFS